MKRRLNFGLIVFFALSATVFAQTKQTIKLNVKGIEIGTKYPDVLEKLGKPLSNKKGGFFPCDNGQMQTLRFPGLIIKLIEAGDGPYFFVASMQVTSSNWQVSPGIKIGKSLNAVKTNLGTSKIRTENGLKNLPYFITDGYANFYFRNNKLIKIAWELNAC